MADNRTLEALQAITAQTVRAVTQTASIQAAASELHSSNSNPRAVANKPETSSSQATTNAAPNATTVELSPAAKFPPVLAASSLAALQAHRPDAVLTAFIDLPALFSEEKLGGGKLSDPKSNLPADRMRQSLALATQLSRASMSAEHENILSNCTPIPAHTSSSTYVAKSYQAMQPWQNASAAANFANAANTAAVAGNEMAPLATLNAALTNAAPANSASAHNVPPNSTATLLQQYSQSYQLAAPSHAEAHFARMEIGVFEENAHSAASETQTYSASLQLQLPHLGTVVIQLVLSEQQTDIAIQALPNQLALLKAQQSHLENAAHAWGLHLHTLAYSPLTTKVQAS